MNIESVRLFHRFGGGRCKLKKCSVLCCNVFDACTISNDASAKSKFVLNVMSEPIIDLFVVAIPPPRNRDWRWNDITSNPLGANLTVFALSPWAMFRSQIEVNAIIFNLRWYFATHTSHIVALHWLCFKWSNNEWILILSIRFNKSNWTVAAWKMISNVLILEAINSGKANQGCLRTYRKNLSAHVRINWYLSVRLW